MFRLLPLFLFLVFLLLVFLWCMGFLVLLLLFLLVLVFVLLFLGIVLCFLLCMLFLFVRVSCFSVASCGGFLGGLYLLFKVLNIVFGIVYAWWVCMSKTYATLGELRTGSFIIIDGEPCKIVEITKAKTGKHGSAKAHVVAVSLFTGSKKTLIAPVDQRVEVPIVDKRIGQVIADMGNMVQVMDLETYETFEIEKPGDPELAGKLKPGVEVEYWEVLGRRIIMRTR